MNNSQITSPCPVLVVGSAHMDVLCAITGDPQTRDKRGEVAIYMGGTGYNLAANLASLGVGVTFLTATGTSPFSRLILDSLEKGGVDVRAITYPNLPIAGFVAHILEGELLSAVSSMPIDRIRLDTKLLSSLVESACAVVIDCNLAHETILDITQRAREKRVPFYLAAVSQEKSTRLEGATQGSAGVFMNREEAAYLADHLGFALNPLVEATSFSSFLGCPVVITLDRDGALYATETNCVKSASVELPLLGGNFLGCGDYLMARVIFELRKGSSPEVALRLAQTGLEGHATRKNCNTQNPNAMDDSLNEIEAQARVDGLTGLPNRRTVTQALARRIGRKGANGELGGISLVIFDIDHFKTVNDQWGHDAGDKVLRALADVATTVVRPEDMLGRWGGEEFLWVMNCSESEAVLAAERLRNAISARLLWPRQITVSLGVAEIGLNEDTPTFVDRADSALYFSKETGRNKVTAFSQLSTGQGQNRQGTDLAYAAEG